MKNVPICLGNEEKPENFKKIPINTHVCLRHRFISQLLIGVEWRGEYRAVCNAFNMIDAKIQR